ncbi:Deaminated glutathione amidase [Hirschfeldia incana]|nr:Deaminated glutathione amidase [Hirschfeldia incana]
MNTCCASVDLTKASLPTQIPMATIKNTVRVAAVQMTSVNDLMANFKTCSRIVQEAASAGAKLVCFPENFSYMGEKSGDNVKIAESLDGPVMQRYCSLARDSNIWLSLGGFQERFDDTRLYNTHVVIDDTGMIQSTYQKMHLFDVDVPGGSTYKESNFTVPGTNIVSVDSPIGRLGLTTVCYDLRFPKIYQQLRFDQKAQVILVPSAFTTVTGEAHWEILLRARAIETQCYVIAASQAGKHNEKRESYGDTLIIDPWGSVVGRLHDRFSTGIIVADIDFSLLESVRTKMPIDKQRVSIDL